MMLQEQKKVIYPVVVIGAGVDYLTITTQKTDKRIVIKEIAQTLVDGFVQEGSETVKEWRFKGYRGWQAGPVKWGHRNDSDIMMVHGQLADDVRHDELTKPHRVRRLDLQVTVDLIEPKPGIIHKAWTNLQDKAQDARINTSSRLLQNSEGGATLYLGARTSDRLARLYDKGVQSEIAVPGKILRYEIELKRDVAQAYWDSLRDQSYDKEVVLSWVWTYFADRGITPVFPNQGAPVAIEYNVRNSSIDRTLIWLAEQVRPSVARVLLAGRGQELSEALQISFVDKGTGELLAPLDNEEKD